MLNVSYLSFFYLKKIGDSLNFCFEAFRWCHGFISGVQPPHGLPCISHPGLEFLHLTDWILPLSYWQVSCKGGCSNERHGRWGRGSDMDQPPQETIQQNQQAGRCGEGGGAAHHPGPVGAGGQADLCGLRVDAVVHGDHPASSWVHRLCGLRLCRCVPVHVEVGGRVAVGGRRGLIQRGRRRRLRARLSVHAWFWLLLLGGGRRCRTRGRGEIDSPDLWPCACVWFLPWCWVEAWHFPGCPSSGYKQCWQSCAGGQSDADWEAFSFNFLQKCDKTNPWCLWDQQTSQWRTHIPSRKTFIP